MDEATRRAAKERALGVTAIGQQAWCDSLTTFKLRADVLALVDALGESRKVNEELRARTVDYSNRMSVLVERLEQQQATFKTQLRAATADLRAERDDAVERLEQAEAALRIVDRYGELIAREYEPGSHGVIEMVEKCRAALASIPREEPSE